MDARQTLVVCSHCRAEVVPEQNLQDTISLYCPHCKRPVTGLKARKIFFVVTGLIAVVILIALASIVFYMLTRFDGLIVEKLSLFRRTTFARSSLI